MITHYLIPVASDLLKKDLTSLEKTNELADKNTGRLEAEAERLSVHTQTLCRCWIWFVVLVVTVTFIGELILRDKCA